MIPKHRRPTHPGEILQYEFLQPLAITPKQLAEALQMQPDHIEEILAGKRAVTADTALRLAKLFDTTPDFWIGLQVNVDLWEALQANADEYERISPIAKG